ncbi:MAG TPA: hypothetical protein DGG95_05980 [Cytophagales bacterium]|jgi:hypothetical protein|nr:hypothetical protein [Cytophagales bacterium]
MFKMTSNIVFTIYFNNGFNNEFKKVTVKPNAIKWSRSIYDLSDTATIILPAVGRLTRGIDGKKIKTTDLLIGGTPVSIYAGYDNKNDLHFKGFISRVNFKIPVEIECEGYSYILRNKLGIDKSYKNTTVKSILQELIGDTEIKLHPDIPNIPIEKCQFINASGIQVLEWFKEKCLLTVYFVYDQIYVGGDTLVPGQTIKLRLGWNVVKDDELKFHPKEFADVKISILNRQANGQFISQTSSNNNGQISGIKKIRTLISDPKTMKAIAERERTLLVNSGYEGMVTAFLKPFATPGMVALIYDTKFKQRTGKYFITGIEGSFSKSGGRQKIKIGYFLGKV